MKATKNDSTIKDEIMKLIEVINNSNISIGNVECDISYDTLKGKIQIG